MGLFLELRRHDSFNDLLMGSLMKTSILQVLAIAFFFTVPAFAVDPTTLVFSKQPASLYPNDQIPDFSVSLLDAHGALIKRDGVPVEMVALDRKGNLLSSLPSVSSVGGVATFKGLSFKQAIAGVTLRARVKLARSYVSVLSSPFDVIWFAQFQTYDHDSVITCQPISTNLAGKLRAPLGTALFVEGFEAEMGYYGELLTLMCQSGIKVVAYDSLGQGARKKLAGVTIPNSAQEGGGHFQAYLDQLKLIVNTYIGTTPFALVGHSLGGGISLAYAMQNPKFIKSSVKRMILASPYTGLPVDQFKGLQAVNFNFLGIVGATVTVKLLETIERGADYILANPSVWGLELNATNLASLIAPSVRVRVCVRILFGSVCGDRWVSVKESDVLRAIESNGDYNGLAINGEFPRFLALGNLVEAHRLLNDSANQAKLNGTGLKLSVHSANYASSFPDYDKDLFTPISVVDPFVRSLKGVTLQRSYADRPTIEYVMSNLPAFTPSAHWVVEHPLVERAITSDVLDSF